jgi:hypothetical protein
LPTPAVILLVDAAAVENHATLVVHVRNVKVKTVETPSDIVSRLLEADLPIDFKDTLMGLGDERQKELESNDLNFVNAETASELYHKTAVYADGVTPVRARRNGRTQTWKRKPGLFRIPIKIGLYEYGQIDNYDKNNAHEWTLKAFTHKSKQPRIRISF